MTRVKVVGIDKYTPQEHGVSAALMDLLSLGIQLGKTIGINADSSLIGCPMLELGPVLQHVIDETSIRTFLGDERAMTSPSMQDLHLSGFSVPERSELTERLQLRQLGVIASALTAARTVKTLTMGLGIDNVVLKARERFVKWLACTLFSKDSISSISSIEIFGAAFAKDIDCECARSEESDESVLRRR